MPDTFVERNPVHVDDADMDFILASIRSLGRDPEPMDQKRSLKAAWWVLILHWLTDDGEHFAFDTFLTVVGTTVWKHFRERGKDPPARIDVVDIAGKPLASHAVEEPESEEEP